MSKASVHIARRRPTVAHVAAALGMGLACLICVINVFWFTWVAANPLPGSDAWYFIEVFVSPAMDGTLSMADFFSQRSSDDHAQPLQKLILWLHLHLAHLDFTVEALVGVLLAVLTTVLLAILLLRGRQEKLGQQAYRMLGVIALFAIALSLNSTVLYTWSLVALGWVLLLVSVFYWLGAGVIKPWRHMAIYGLLASFSMAMVLDELAFPVLIAVIIAVGVREGLRRPASLTALAISGAMGVAVARGVLSALSPGASIAASAGGSFGQLLDVIRAPDAWQLLVGPLSGSLVHRLHLQELSPALGDGVQWALALTLAAAHLGFWWRALVSRRLPSGETTVVAVSLMLLFYATIAGIMLSRVPMFGVEYVHQPRYVLMYQLNVIALLLMFFAPRAAMEEAVRTRSPASAIAAAGALLIIGLQLPLSVSAWDYTPYLRPYVQRSEEILRQLAVDPSKVPAGGCTDVLTICDAPAATRGKVVGLLAANKLNLFSPEFRARHGFDPLLDEAQQRLARENSLRACNHAVVDWGPKSIVPGQSFYPQADGRSAYWVKLDPKVGAMVLNHAGERVNFDRASELISFLHDPAWLAGANSESSLAFEIQCEAGGQTAFQVQVMGQVGAPAPAKP